jgi:hypothetical protein
VYSIRSNLVTTENALNPIHSSSSSYGNDTEKPVSNLLQFSLSVALFYFHTCICKWRGMQANYCTKDTQASYATIHTKFSKNWYICLNHASSVLSIEHNMTHNMTWVWCTQTDTTFMQSVKPTQTTHLRMVVQKCNINSLKPDGYYMYHLPHTVCLYDPHSKQRLFPQIALTGWAL